MEHTPTQENFLSNLLENINLSQNSFLFLVKGEGGSGKTTISDSIHKDFNLVSYYFINNNSIRELVEKQKFSDFKTFILKNGKANSLRENIFMSILFAMALIPILIQIIYFIIVESKIFFIRTSGKKSINILYSNKDQRQFYCTLRKILLVRGYFSKIKQLYNRFIKKDDRIIVDHNILIFDEINFYDDDYIVYIKDLFFDHRLRNVSPIFNNIKIIINYTTNYYSGNALKELLKLIENKNQFELKSYDDRDIDFLCSKRSENINEIVKNSLEKIKNISLHSNLALVNNLIDYISDKRTIDSYYLEVKNSYSIIKKYLDSEFYLFEILELLSLTPDEILVQEIIELSRLRSNDKYVYDSEVKNLLFKASNKKFILPEGIQINISNRAKIKFAAAQFKEYFKPKDKNFIIIFYRQYAEVMKLINPGDYLERATYYELSGDNENAELFRFMYFAQACYSDTIEEIEEMKLENYIDFCSLLKKAYYLYYIGKFNEVYLCVDKMNLCSTNILTRFELDLIKCKALLVSADKNKIDIIRKNMSYYMDNIDKSEREIFVRIKLVLFLVELYDGNNDDTKRLGNEILDESIKLSRVNGRYDYYQYTIRRRAIISNEIESAHEEIKKSVDYFCEKERSSSSKFFMREYFYSLINLSATYRYQSRYEEAFHEAKKALKIYNAFPNHFSNVTLFNTLATTGFESGKLTGEKAVEEYLKPLEKNIDIYQSTESTDYFILNNIACIRAYDDINIGFDYIEKAIFILNNVKDNIDSHKYRLSTNKAVILFLKDKRSDAIKIMNEVKNLQTFHYSSSYHLGRYNTLMEIFSNHEHVQNVLELDRLMEKKHPSITDIERHHNKSLHIWSLQYWSR